VPDHHHCCLHHLHPLLHHCTEIRGHQGKGHLGRNRQGRGHL
jgi:hypothetical protein